MGRLKKKHHAKSSLEIALLCANTAQDKKAEDIIILDVHTLSSFADYFVIMSGRSTRHVTGLAEIIEAEISSKRIGKSNSEGMQEGVWVLLDYTDVIVHIFYKEARGFYDLEGLWHDAPRVEIED